MAASVRAAVGAIAIVLLGAAGHARQDPASQASSQDPQAPTFRAGVNLVRVDVTVTDKSGAPVGDLKPEDFEVVEAGKPQKIETFKLISLDGGLMPGAFGPPVRIRTDADEQAEAARDEVRLFGMFLDDYHVKRDSSLVMRRQLARFVETQLGPSDMIGIMYPLQTLASVRMTRNHDAVRRALEEFEGRKYDYKSLNEAEEKYVYRASPEQIEQIRNQVSFSAIKALIMHMGALKEGRKALILVSEGFSNNLPLRGSGRLLASGRATQTDPGTGSRLSVPSSREIFGAMEINIDLQEIYDLANRNNVAIYPVDPRGLATSEFGIDPVLKLADGTFVHLAVDEPTDKRHLNATMDTLWFLAENSDGRAILNRNDLAIAMKQIVVDTSAYYLLGYNSSLAAADGKFHKITVNVKRKGLEVRHRPGYWALKPADVRRVTAATPARALDTPVTPRSRTIRTWVGIERGENGKTRVTFVWEPIPNLAGAVVREAERPAQVGVTALSPEGASYFRGRVPETPVATSSGSRATFEAEPGRMQLRLSIEGPGSDVIDSEVRDLDIPDLSSPQTSLGTPLVFRARTLPELQRMKTEPQPVPTAAREFSRTDRLVVRVPVYGPAGTTPTLTALLLNRAGQTMSALPVAAPEVGRTMPQIELSLANLSLGDYEISLAATGEGGDAKEVVAFRLVP